MVCVSVQNLLSDFHGKLIIRLKEIVGAVVLDRLPTVLSNIKDYRQTKKATTIKHCAGGRNLGWCCQLKHSAACIYMHVCMCDLPLVGMPIQLRYRVSFLDMYVLPRAGRPTITMTVGGLAKWGAPAAAERGYVMITAPVFK